MRLYGYLFAFALAIAFPGCATLPYLHPDTKICAAMGSPVTSLITTSVTALTAAGPIAMGVCEALNSTPQNTTTTTVMQQSSSGMPAPVKLGIAPPQGMP